MAVSISVSMHLHRKKCCTVDSSHAVTYPSFRCRVLNAFIAVLNYHTPCLQVTGVFGSSMEVLISVCGEAPHIGKVFHCANAFATVVSVDANGEPMAVPFELEPQTRVEKARCAGAAERREERLRMRSELEAQHARRPSLDGTMRRPGGLYGP